MTPQLAVVDGTLTRTVAGPSPRIAHLRALALKAATAATAAWQWIRHGSSLLAHAPGWLGNAVLSALSTPAGYSLAVAAIGATATAVASAADSGIRAIGRLALRIAGIGANALSAITPSIGKRTVDAVSGLHTRVHGAYQSARTWLTRLGALLGSLAGTPIVKAVATRAAALASAAIAVHVISRGAIAARVIDTLPLAVHAIAWITGPLKALALVAIAAIAATAYAGIRIRTLVTAPATEEAPSGEAVLDLGDLDIDYQALARQLRVSVEVDGSITVRGIPAHLDTAQQDRLAAIATEAALAELTAIARNGRPLNSADRRRIANAARAAVRGDAA